MAIDNNPQGFLTGIHGDITSVGPGNALALLNPTGVTEATYGDSTHIPQFIVDASGRIRSVTELLISVSQADVVGLAAALAGKQDLGSYITALVGDGTAVGPGSATFTLANTGVAPAVYGDATNIASFTVDSKGRITSASNIPISIDTSEITGVLGVPNGGTGLSTIPSGLLIFGNGVSPVGTAAGLAWDGTDTLTVPKLHVSTRIVSANGSTSVDSDNRQLSDGISGTTLDWLNRSLTGGDWTATNNLALTNAHDLRFNGAGDPNWRMGININAFAHGIVGGNTIEVVYGNGITQPDGIAFGPSDPFAASHFEINGNTGKAWFRNPLTDGLQVDSLDLNNRQLVGNWTATGTFSSTNISGSSSGTNTGDVSLLGENYLSILGQAITANPVDLSGSNATGVLAAARFPALTGDVTTVAGNLSTTVANIGGIAVGADPLSQYALLMGRVGGQTLIGGTAASNSLILQATSNATPGNINFNINPTTTVFSIGLDGGGYPALIVPDAGEITGSAGNTGALYLYANATYNSGLTLSDTAGTSLFSDGPISNAGKYMAWTNTGASGSNPFAALISTGSTWTTGDLLRINNNTTHAMVVDYAGNTTISGTLDVGGFIDLKEITTPSPPAAGIKRLYFDSLDHQLKFMDSTGAVNVVQVIAGF